MDKSFPLSLEERYRTIYEESCLPIFESTMSGEVLSCNKACAELFGFTGTESFVRKVKNAGKDLYADPSKREEFIGLITRVSGMTVFSAVFKRRDGSVFEGRIKAQPVKDEEGNPRYIFGFIEDITKEEAYKSNLSENLNLLQILIDTMPNPVFYKDANGVYIGANKAFAEFIGIEKEDIIGKTVYDVAPKRLAATYHSKDAELLNSQSRRQVYQTIVKDASGGDRDVIFYKAVYRLEKDSDAGIIGVITDVTEMNDVRRKLEKKVEALESFKQITLGRELRMVELKSRIEELEAELRRSGGGK